MSSISRLIAATVSLNIHGTYNCRPNSTSSNINLQEGSVVIELTELLRGTSPLKKLSDTSIQYIQEHPEILNLASERRNPMMQNSLLLEAISKNFTQVACYFIELDTQAKANTLNQPDKYPSGNNTPLLLAFKKANWVVVRKLLEQKEIDVNCKDHFGFSSLHWAAIHRAPKDIINSLFIAGAVDFEIFLDLISHNESISRLHTHTAKQLYEEIIIYGIDLIYPSHFKQIKRDSTDFIGTFNPLFSDLHWHVTDIIKNAFENRYKELKQKNPIVVDYHFGAHIEHAQMIFSEEREKLPVEKDLLTWPAIA